MRIDGIPVRNLSDFINRFRWNSEECQELILSGEVTLWLLNHGHEALAEEVREPLQKGDINVVISLIYVEYIYEANGVRLIDFTNSAQPTANIHAHVFVSPEAARLSDIAESRRKYIESFLSSFTEMNALGWSTDEPLIQVFWKTKSTDQTYRMLSGEDGDFINRLYPLEPPLGWVDYFDQPWRFGITSQGFWVPAKLVKSLIDGDRIEFITPMTLYNPVDRILGEVPPATKEVIVNLIAMIDQGSSGFPRRYRKFAETFDNSMRELPMTGPLTGLGQRPKK